MYQNTPFNLYVDDNRACPEGWIPARSAEEAMYALLMCKVDRVSMDFDLDCPDCPECNFECPKANGGHEECPCACHTQGDMNGLHLLEWMKKYNRWPKQKPDIHSSNEEGAEAMKEFIDANYPVDVK